MLKNSFFRALVIFDVIIVLYAFMSSCYEGYLSKYTEKCLSKYEVEATYYIQDMRVCVLIPDSTSEDAITGVAEELNKLQFTDITIIILNESGYGIEWKISSTVSLTN